MGATAILCVAIGLFPHLLTDLLPGGTPAHPFAASHLLESAGIFAVAGVLLALVRPLRRSWGGFETDIDTLYIQAGRAVVWFSSHPLVEVTDAIGRGIGRVVACFQHVSANPAAAIQIAWKTLALPFVRIFWGLERSAAYEKDLVFLRDNYPEIQTSIWGGSYGIMFICIIAFLYFLFSLT